jgi:hypothetical protein
MSANKQRDGHIDASDEDEPMPKQTGAEKSMKKLVHRHEKNDAYDSDDEEANPYASEARSTSFIEIPANAHTIYHLYLYRFRRKNQKRR